MKSAIHSKLLFFAAILLVFSFSPIKQIQAKNETGKKSAGSGAMVLPRKNQPQKPALIGKQSDRFSNILLYTQHGKPVRFYDDLVKDKVVMINLMYTTCPKICPGNSSRLAVVHDLLEKWMGRDISILSLSIDPDVDTPKRLKEYWEAFGTKPGWTFLTGNYNDIDRLRRELGVYDLDPVIDADKTQHAGIITIGNDRTNRWIALPILMHTQQLAETVLRTTWDSKWQRGSKQKNTKMENKSRSYRAKGIVRSIDVKNRQVLIEHKNIPGLMPAMTMMFGVPEPSMLERLTPNLHIEFLFEATQAGFKINLINPREG